MQSQQDVRRENERSDHVYKILPFVMLVILYPLCQMFDFMLLVQ